MIIRPIKEQPFTVFSNRLFASARAGRAVILFGAGVSMAPPSCLPSGRELRDAVVKAAIGNDSEKRFWAKISANNRYQEVIPELIFQRLYEVVGNSLATGFNWLDQAPTNSTHEILAKLAIEFKTPLLTTNFEQLVENAASTFGGSANIIHLHGSCNEPSTMGMRLNIVGRGIQKTTKKKALDLLAQHELFVVGYSFNDEDIRKLVMKSNVKQVYWLLRSKNDWALQNYELLNTLQGRTIITFADICQLKPTHPKLLPVNPTSPSIKATKLLDHIDWQIGANQLSPHLTKSMQRQFLLALLFEIGEHALGEDLCKNFLKTTQDANEKTFYYNQLTNIARKLGSATKVKKLAQLACHYAQKATSAHLRSMAYNYAGLALLESKKSNPQEALIEFNKSLEVMQNCDAHDRRTLELPCIDVHMI